MKQAKENMKTFIFWASVTSKVVMFQVATALMVLGILYLMNFRISIQPIITTVSPIVEEAHE